MGCTVCIISTTIRNITLLLNEHVSFNDPIMKIVKFVYPLFSIAVHENECKRFAAVLVNK